MEYKKFEKHVQRLKAKGYDVEEIDIYEFILGLRASMKSQDRGQTAYPEDEDLTEPNEIAWKQIREVKKIVAATLQGQAINKLAKIKNEKLFDLDDYEEIDP